MAEGSELMHRLLSENADLKKQVRLLKENQMLKRLLSESCPDRCGLGGRDLLFTKGPAYPEDGSPGSAGLSKPRPSSPFCCTSSVADFGRFASAPDARSQLQTSSLEDLLCSHAPISSEDDASPGCATSGQVPFKAFLSSPELRAPRGADRKLSPLLSPLQDPLADKTLLEPREMVRPKKVCFSESSLPSGDRTRRSYYLNGLGRETGSWWATRINMEGNLQPAPPCSSCALMCCCAISLFSALTPGKLLQPCKVTTEGAYHSCNMPAERQRRGLVGADACRVHGPEVFMLLRRQHSPN
ncbi:speriolin-like protein isoform X6 [Mustela lutreola]|uniref:speriolin-like protein isoform X6 n=1 Tax=Mustela lutreola TaxID=9666 RepID=UPI002797AB6B|nr:speriolin-like protein isoform X6 [Mustela lutreola]